MRRFYLPPAACQDGRFSLVDAEAHHALHVLRVGVGERVAVLDGVGHELLCEVGGVARARVDLVVLQRHDLPRRPAHLTLLQAVTKGKSMELIVQKATELGAARIVPILSERCVLRLEADDAERKAEKWRAIAIEALKQCGTPWLPTIDEPIAASAFLAQTPPFGLMLLASLQSGARHPRALLHAARQDPSHRPDSVAVWVGPEGDFTPAEINQIRSAGALPITLGPLVLRSETAALYCLSVLAYELEAPPAP